jgi:hypothetical protein
MCEAILFRVYSFGLLATISRIFSHMLRQTAHGHLEDNQFQACLVNTWKYTLRWMSLVGIMSSVFYYSCTCIATTKSIHKIHVTIFSVGKHKRHGYNTSQLNETMTNAEYEVPAAICLAWLSTQGWTRRVHRYRMLNEYSTVHGTARRPHSSLTITSITIQIWI